jgi:hypothetical protein
MITHELVVTGLPSVGEFNEEYMIQVALLNSMNHSGNNIERSSRRGSLCIPWSYVIFSSLPFMS